MTERRQSRAWERWAAIFAIGGSLIAFGAGLQHAADQMGQLARHINKVAVEMRAVRDKVNALARYTCGRCQLPADPPEEMQ